MTPPGQSAAMIAVAGVRVPTQPDRLRSRDGESVLSYTIQLWATYDCGKNAGARTDQVTQPRVVRHLKPKQEAATRMIHGENE